MLELRGSLVKRLYCVPFIVDVADFPRLRSSSGACNITHGLGNKMLMASVCAERLRQRSLSSLPARCEVCAVDGACVRIFL